MIMSAQPQVDTFRPVFQPKSERKINENAKYSFGRKRKWPKPSKLIFCAENENKK